MQLQTYTNIAIVHIPFIGNKNITMKRLRWNSEQLTKDQLKQLKSAARKASSFSAFSISVGIERMALDGIIKRGTATPQNVEKIKSFLLKAHINNAA